MIEAEPMQDHVDTTGTVAAAMAGDEPAFAALFGRHRRELQVHCYRMLGSLEDAEDVTQETFLRAWRRRETFAGRSTVRAWLYRIATNACLDALARRPERAPAPPGSFEVPWLQPCPDELLDGIATADPEPHAVVTSRETIELAYIVAVQHLAPRPRAALILHDVLGWSARDTAELLGTSVAGVNSGLQRARVTLRERLPERRADWAPGPDAGRRERALVQRYVEATERGDADGLAAMMREDARFAMPPHPVTYDGREAILASWDEVGFGTEDWGELRCRVTAANRQPAVAAYLRRPGDGVYKALALDVLRLEDGAIAEIMTFGSNLFPAFGLPAEL